MAIADARRACFPCIYNLIHVRQLCYANMYVMYIFAYYIHQSQCLFFVFGWFSWTQGTASGTKDYIICRLCSLKPWYQTL